MDQPLLALVSVGCLVAAAVWGRSARYREKLLQRLERESGDADLKSLTRSDFRKDLHTTVLYGVLGCGDRRRRDRRRLTDCSCCCSSRCRSRCR